MKRSAVKVIAALEIELAAAVATKAEANEAGDEVVFYAACERVNYLTEAIRQANQPKFAGCNISRELASNNVD